MSNESLMLGSGNWAAKTNNLLGYVVGDISAQFTPREFTFSRGSTATFTNPAGVIQSSASGIARVQNNALLLEPQRTNLALQSSSFDNTTTWINAISGTGVNPIITANTTISPSGVQDADTIFFDRGVGNTLSDLSIINQQITIATTGTYYFSVWLKATASGDVGKQVFIRCGVAGILQVVTLTSNWVRYETTASVTAGSNSFQIGNRGTITTNNSVSVDIWGAQLEAGAFATTYIPTTNATATRLADTFSISNVFTNGWISSLGGTWYVELRNNIAYTRDTPARTIILSDDINGTNCFTIRNAGGGSVRLTLAKVIANTNTNLYTTLTDTVKIAIKWNGTSADVFVNGTKQVSATAFTTTVMQFLNGIGTDVPTFIQAMALYPTPLSDAQCQALTT